MHSLEAALRAIDMTQATLSRLSGVAPGTISKIVTGTSEFRTNVDTAALLASALGMRIGDLFAMEELSHLGRPPASGVELTVTHKRQVVITEVCCTDCYVTGPIARFCTSCGTPLDV